MQSLVDARGTRPFRNLEDFARRIDSKQINKRIYENLAAAGAFDALEPDRARAFAAGEQVLATAQRTREDDLADGLFLRAAARTGDARDRNRHIGIAVRQHAGSHCPGGCQ